MDKRENKNEKRKEKRNKKMNVDSRHAQPCIAPTIQS